MTQIKYRKQTGEEYTKTDSRNAKPFVWFVDGTRYENHYPDHSLLISEGYYKIIAKTPTATQKLGTEWVYVGEECWIEILDKTAEELAAEATQKISDNIHLIRNACKHAIDVKADIHWTAGPMVFDKAKSGMPKSKAIKEWVEGCWAQYYVNVAALMAGAPFDEAMLVYPESPYPVWEAIQE